MSSGVHLPIEEPVQGPQQDPFGISNLPVDQQKAILQIYQGMIADYSRRLTTVEEMLTGASNRNELYIVAKSLEEITTQAHEKQIPLEEGRVKGIKKALREQIPPLDLEDSLRNYRARLDRIPTYDGTRQETERRLLRRDLGEATIRAYIFNQNPTKLKAMEKELNPY
jgi:hypothetical protein|tara:strand:+ start:62 stop:565 length:504 start_codon:yes stop_codon:yes gene_type:complete